MATHQYTLGNKPLPTTEEIKRFQWITEKKKKVCYTMTNIEWINLYNALYN